MAKKKKRRLMTDIYAEFPNANIYGEGDEMQIKRGYTSNQIPIEIDVPQAQYNPSQFQRVNPIKYLTMSERDKAIQKSERMRYNEWKQTNQQPETTETNPSGGNTNWGGVIGAAATGVLSGIKDNDWSTKEGRTRGIFQSLGVADAANNWLADTSKGDTNITEMHNRINDATNKFITDSNDTQGAFSAIKNNNNVNLINTTVKRLNEKDFRQSWGSYWKNTLTGGLQGASAGSVGGPWGALGGAVTGVVSGLLGGFGRKRRARKAYEEYKNKMDYMQNFAGNFNTLQKLNQKQSNENLLNNGLKQQRIQELSNIRAFGGNLFEDGGEFPPPYYPESQDPTAIQWLSNWYNQRPEQLKNTFYGSTYEMPNPNISGEYEDLNEIPKERILNPTNHMFGDDLYKNLIDRAATTSTLYRMDMPYGTLGEYSPAGKGILTENGPVDKSNAAHTISFNMRDIPAFANPEEEYYDKETLPLRVHEYNHPITHGFESLANSINSKVKRKDGVKYDEYKDNPYEIHSYMMEFRQRAGLDPTEKITKDVLDKHRTELKKSNLDRFTDDSLIDILNNVANNNNNNNQYNNIAAMGGYFDTFNLSPNMINMQNKSLDNQKYKYNNQMQPLGFLGDSKSNIFDGGGKIKTYDDNDIWYRDENGELQVRPHQNTGKYTEEDLKRDVYLSSALNWDDYQRRLRDYENPPSYFNDFKAYNNPFSSANVVDRLINHYFDNKDKQKENEHKSSSSINFGGGGNSFDFGGTMNSMNLPTDMQSYGAGGTHEENPYGGIQVGVDNQGTPNLVEEGEFRYGNYIFSDRINVDPALLSEFNLSPLSKGKKKNNESYADVAKKMVKKAGDLNDLITKDTLDVNMSRLQQAQDAQKYKAQQDQEYADYKSALKTPTQGNPMYGSMKYNGMGDVNQGLNEGNAMASSALDNSELSNVNRSGNPMMAAYGGNIFKEGTGNLQIGFRKIKEPTLNWDNLALQRSLPNPQFISGSNFNDNALFEPVDYTQMARSNDSNWVNDKWDAYGELNNYYTPEQIANMRGTYGMSISGGVDKPFVQALQNDLKKRGYYTGNIDGVFGPKTRMALDKMNGTSAWTGQNGKYVAPAGGSNSYSYKYDISRTTSDVLNKDAVSGNPTISKDATASGSTHNPQQNIDKSGEIQRLSGTYAVGKPFDAPTYSTKGRFATNAKFLPLALADSVGFTNFDYDPNLAPNYDLVAAGKTGYVPRTADHSGMYRAADLFDINAANNASQATNMAMLRGIANNSNNNRGFLGAQTSALDYNGLIGTGQNFATMFDKNNASRIAAYQDNKQTEQANVDVNNQMYHDNQQAGIQAKQMELNTLAQSMADQTQKELYADKTNREAHDNIAGTQNLMWNNSMQFLMDEAKRNDLYNKFNSNASQMWYYDKKLGKYIFKGDPATVYLGDAIRAKEGVTSLDADLQNEYNNYVANVGSENVQRDYLDSLVERQAQRNKENEAKSIADRNAQMQSDIDFMNNQFSDLDNLIITDKDKSYKFFDYINSPKQVEAIRNFLNNADVSQMNPNDYKNYKALLNNWIKIRDRQLIYRNQMSPYNVTDTTNTTWVGQSNAYGGHINTKKKRNKRYTDI